MGILAKWMTEHDESDQSLAPKVGVSRVHVSRLRRLVYNPSPDLAKRLEAVTGLGAAELIYDGRDGPSA